MTSFVNQVQNPPLYPTFFWKGRGESKAYLGLGEGKSSPIKLKIRSFYPGSSQGVWEGFPSEWDFIPDQLVSSDENLTPSQTPLPPCLSRSDLPSQEEWIQSVTDVKQLIKDNILHKIVLARQTTLTFASPVSPYTVLTHLMSLGSTTSLFMVQLDPETAFMGATPELLFSREGHLLKTEALAGTLLEHEPWSAKEFAEVDAVRVYLQEKLLPYCESLEWKAPEEKKFRHLKHLYQKLEGVLKPQILDDVLITALHPTPALGGAPKNRALDYLKKHEPFDRGWYGSPIGLVKESTSEIAVGIRSLLIRGHEVHLFSGAGIVKESDPLKEWEEIERKIAHLLQWFKTAPL
ncbi:MAG: isochorismate synthase [Candidatus Rhabdochlamydia sp.]